MAHLTRLLFFLAAFFAWRLSKITPRYLAVAVALDVALWLDLARAVLALAIAAEPTPFTGWARALFHVDQALLLSFPTLSAALALIVFRRVDPLDAGFAATAILGYTVAHVAWGYPENRAGWMDSVAMAFAFSAFVQGACAAVYLWRSPWRVGLPERACLLLLAGDAAALLGPWLGAPLEHWELWHLQSCVTLGTLATLEAKWILALSPNDGPSPSARSSRC